MPSRWSSFTWSECTSSFFFSSYAGILKKKQLSPIVERNGLNRIHNELCENAPGTESPWGSSSSDGRAGPAKPSLPDQLNGVAMSIKAGTVDGDSSGSEWVLTQAETHMAKERKTISDASCFLPVCVSSAVSLCVAEVIQCFVQLSVSNCDLCCCPQWLSFSLLVVRPIST